LAAAVTARLKLDAIPLDRLVELFECIYYASLKTEEARQVSVSVTFIDPSNPAWYLVAHAIRRTDRANRIELD